MKSRKAWLTAIAVTLILLFSLSTITFAQSDALGMIYESSSYIATNIHGVRTFADVPKGFDILKASDAELATYGFPPRPNAATDPDGYGQWARAMSVAKTRWHGQPRDMGFSNLPMKSATQPTAVSAAAATSAAVSATPSTAYSYNWSGIANTNKLTKWNKSSSFYNVLSTFNVPVAQQSFGTCSGYYDLEVSWNGIDGFSNGDVLQGGSLSQDICSNNTLSTAYCGWVEWYPSYNVLCEFDVNPGDDMYVETYSPLGGTNTGYVYIEDLTTLTYNSYALTWLTGPGLVGNSVEYIVERPGGGIYGLYPLGNYIDNFWASSLGYTFTEWDLGKPSTAYPGSTASSTYLVDMLDDAGDQVISVPAAQGKTGLFFYDTGCAFTGGCVP